MEQKLITFDPNGVGEDYGIQYHGEDMIKFLKAIHHLIVDKKMNLPLPSHHGLDFRLKKFKLSLTLLNANWTHLTKGNGNSPLRIVLDSQEWFLILDENGNTVNTSRALLTEKAAIGFKKALERAGFELVEKENKFSFAYNLKYNANFVAHILTPENKTEKYLPDIANPDYEREFNNFLDELKKIFEYYQVIR